MNKVLSYIQYIVLFAIIYWLATVIEVVPGFDLHRTYEEANFYVEEFSVFEMILYRLAKTIDFVYYLIHYYALKSSIPSNLLTATIVFIYYCLVIYAMKRVYGNNVPHAVVLITLFTVPSIYVISIARNLTAFMFLFCAVVAYYKGHRLLSLLFVVIAVFTHFTTLMYVAVFLSAFFLRKSRISDKTLAVLLISVFFISLISPMLISNLMFNVISGEDLYYETYSKAGAQLFLLNSYINYADKLPVLMAYIYSIVLLFYNKQRGLEFWALLLLVVMLSFFMNSSFSLVVRCMMFLPIFWALNVGNIYKYSSKKSKTALQNFSLIGLMSLLLHIYGYRQIYLAFL